MSSCIKHIRKQMANACCAWMLTTFFTVWQLVGMQRASGAGLELGYLCSRGWTPDISPVNGSFFRISPCGYNQTIMPQSGFWCIWHTTHPHTAHPCRRQMTSISYGSSDEKVFTGVSSTRFMGTSLTSVTGLFFHLPPATIYVSLHGTCGIFPTL
jgi:hypothetical protein